MTKFIFTPDKHVGWQQVPGKGLQPLHCLKSISAMLNFASDFLPDTWIEGGDNMDFGPLSHWLKHKKKSSEGLDLSKDAEEYRIEVLQPINEIMSRRSREKSARCGSKATMKDGDGSSRKRTPACRPWSPLNTCWISKAGTM